MNTIKVFSFFFTVCFLGSQAYGQCEKFDNYPEGKDEGQKVHVLYRDFMKRIKIIEKDKTIAKEDKAKQLSENYDKALKLWTDIYTHAPAGSEYHPIDGINIHSYLAKVEKDETKQKEYHDKVLSIYDDYIRCYGQKKTKSGKTKEGDLLRRKGMYMYSAKYEDKATYDILKKSMDLEQKDTRASVLQVIVYKAVSLFKTEALTKEEMRTLYDELTKICQENIEAGDKNYEIALNKIQSNYEPIERFVFDCPFYVEKLKPLLNANYNDVQKLKTEVATPLIRAGCEENEPLVVKVLERMKTLTDSLKIVNMSSIDWAIKYYNNDEYDKAIEFFEKGIAEETDPMVKAKAAFQAAQIAYSKKKDYPKARELAEKALEYRPNWGEPYLLIGNLYASSGPLCGTGRGFESQRVVWAALDMWQKAKKVDSDPKIQENANKQIREYTQFLPEKGDLFQRNLNVGNSYFIPCWIQRNTTIRAKPE